MKILIHYNEMNFTIEMPAIEKHWNNIHMLLK